MVSGGRGVEEGRCQDEWSTCGFLQVLVSRISSCASEGVGGDGDSCPWVFSPYKIKELQCIPGPGWFGIIEYPNLEGTP